MTVPRELRRALSGLVREPALLLLAVGLALVRPPPGLVPAGVTLVHAPVVTAVGAYAALAVLTWTVSPVAMAGLLVAADNALRERPAAADLWGRVRGRYARLALANVALGGLAGVAIALVGGLVASAWLGVTWLVSSGGVPGAAGPVEVVGLAPLPVQAALLVTVTVGLGVLVAVDVAVRFVRPAVVVGERGVREALRESVALVREHPRATASYYLHQRAVGLALGGLALTAPFAVGLVPNLGPLTAGLDPSTTVSPTQGLALAVVAYAARATTYAVTLPFSVNVYQYLRFRSGRVASTTPVAPAADAAGAETEAEATAGSGSGTGAGAGADD